jgi:hypothetical protein
MVGAYLEDDTVVIVNPTHPVMTGLTSAGLSGWGSSSWGNFTKTPGLTVLVTNGSIRPITLAGTFGQGRVVITDLDPDYQRAFGVIKGAQVRFVQNAINWVARVVAGHVDAVVPAARKRVTLINRITGAELTSSTNARGDYCFVGVEPGPHDVTIEAVIVP